VSSRPRSERDNLIIARLFGASSRHAGWRDPTGGAREDAIAELRSIASRYGKLRADLLAEATGICRGTALANGLSAPQLEIMAGLLVDAGADLGLVDQWMPIGQERASRKLHP
jgi:hypothetical protein